MTYAQLQKILASVPSHKLDADVSIYAPDGEFYPLAYVAVSNDNGVLDDGHLYLSADEVLFEDDKAVGEWV
jgi:hypothetical protein